MAKPKSHRHRGTFADGESDPEQYPEDQHVGTFADGECDPERYPEDRYVGTFADGEEPSRAAP